MSSLQSCICPLVPGFQQYAWGKPAADATGTVAAMFRAHAPPAVAASLDPSTTFAEAWMGTHPSCPSEVEAGVDGGRVKLSEHLKERRRHLAAAQQELEGHDGDLPYLFKVNQRSFQECIFLHT